MSGVLDHFDKLIAATPSPTVTDPCVFLDEARAIIAERGEAYGGVEDSFERAAAIASLKLNKTITAYDVATVLESVKDARKALNPTHRDSHIDGINYSAFRAAFALKGT